MIVVDYILRFSKKYEFAAYPLLLCLSRWTTSSVSTTVSTAPKLPSEITGKTVEEVFHVFIS
jgi:hypothetical protein